MPEADASTLSITAITSARSLLTDPDPVPELTKQLATALRLELGKLQDELFIAFEGGEKKLKSSTVWGLLTEEQRTSLSTAYQLVPPQKSLFGTDNEILEALSTRTLADRRNLLDAVPQRFSRAIEEASRLLVPKAVRVSLPGGTIQNTAELDKWLTDVRQQVEVKLKDGPVIL